MNNIVVYESKYGSTERYAKWIGEELNCKVARISDVPIDELTNYDNIIFGGWVKAGNLNGFDKLSKNINKLKDKNLLVFGVGTSPTEDKDYVKFKEKNFKEFNNIKSFYLRGAFHFDSLTFPDKMMMSMFKMIVKVRKLDKEGRCMTDMLNKGAKPVDFTKKEYIEPIVNEVRK